MVTETLSVSEHKAIEILARGEWPDSPKHGTWRAECMVRWLKDAGIRLVADDDQGPVEAVSLLTFEALREANATRVDRWHGPDAEPWSGADWSNAMCGEAGEAANKVKKLRRHETRIPGTVRGADGVGLYNTPDVDELIHGLAMELADTLIYADLVAKHYGIDLAAAVVEKFNLVSEAQCFPERLP